MTACASNSAKTSAEGREHRHSSETARVQTEAKLFSESSVEESTDKNFPETPAQENTGNGTSRTFDDATALQTRTVDNITFSLEASLQPQFGEERLFLSPDQAYAYQLQGITHLGDYTPQEFFDMLIETYESKYDVISTGSTVNAYTSPDNVDCYLGNVKRLIDSTFLILMCCMGAYEVYYGQPAMDQVISMTEYGLTAEEMDGALLATQNGYVLSDERRSLLLPDTVDSTDTYQVCLDTFYAIILHNDQYIAPDEEPMKVGNTMLFIGYYIPELQLLDMTNANAASYAQYIYKEPAGETH